MATTRVLLVPDRVGVAILAGDCDLDGYPGELLYGVLAEQAGVVGRAAGDDRRPGLSRRGRVPISERSTAPSGVDAAEERRAEGGGLLVDLLEHVVLVAAELDGLGVPVHLEGLALDGLARER